MSSLQSPIASLAPFPRAKRWQRRLAAAALIVLVLPLGLYMSGAIAQDALADADALSLCMAGASQLGPLEEGTTQRLDPEFMADPAELLEQIFDCSARFGRDQIGPVANAYFIPLLIVMTVWFGIGVMFGGFDPSGVITFVLRVGFAVMLMQNYYWDTPTDTPIGDDSHGVVWLIGQQGIVLGRTIMADARDAVAESRARAAAQQTKQALARDARVELVGAAGAASDDEEAQSVTFIDRQIKRFQNLVLLFIEAGWRTLLWLLSWVVYAQYLWGFIALSVFAVIGPLLIPFILLPQLDWLFWGWVRGLFQNAIYMIVSGVMYVVTAMVLLWPIEAIAERSVQADPQTSGDFLALVGMLTIPYIPVVFVTLVGALKVTGFSGSFMSGGAMPSSGLASSAVTAGKNTGSYALSPQYRSRVNRRTRRTARVLAGAYKQKISDAYQKSRYGRRK